MRAVWVAMGVWSGALLAVTEARAQAAPSTPPAPVTKPPTAAFDATPAAPETPAPATSSSAPAPSDVSAPPNGAPVPPNGAPPPYGSPPPYVAPAYAAAPAPSPPYEDGAPPPDAARPRHVSQIGLDVTIHTQAPQGSTITVVAPMIRGTFWAGPVSLEPDLPLVYYHVRVPQDSGGFLSGGDSALAPGNPTFAAKYHFFADTLDAYVGGGIALPLAQLDQGDANAIWKAVGYSAAIGARGAWNVWWYLPDTVTLFLPVGVRYVMPQGLDLGVEAATGILIYTGSGSLGPRGSVQIGGHVGYASSVIEAGLRLQGVRLPVDTDDNFQASMEPYVRAFLAPVYFGAGFLMNIDKPYGPFLDTGSVWALCIEGGARF
jgi:hypothetical protein